MAQTLAAAISPFRGLTRGVCKMQTTVRKSAKFEGVGVHSGAAATAIVRPAEPGHGIVFKRVDVLDKPNEIPATYDRVVDTRLCTVLANEAGITISTVEHLMAALCGLAIDNALIEIDGPEIPIMDGSSAPFVKGLTASGLSRRRAPRRAIQILRRISVREGDKRASLARARRFEMRFDINFDDAAIGRQSRSMALINGCFVHELASARTFGRLSEVEQLRAAGLARGGSLDNAIVVDGDRVLNPDGLRFKDEFVRHKMLDAVGDLYLAGAPIIGAYRGVRAGHDMTNKLLRALFANPSAWRWVDDDLSVLRKPSNRLGEGVVHA